MKTLLVGFDSAWTAKKKGALVGVVRDDSGNYQELDLPQEASFEDACCLIESWRAEHAVASTIILLDQPTIVPNESGQRPVEHLVSSPVSLRFGGVQPASRSRTAMFGESAPVWQFLSHFGVVTDPGAATETACVIETYPVLAMIALDWVLPDARSTGRLPKYNPQRRGTFALNDWEHVCDGCASSLALLELRDISAWIYNMRDKSKPTKQDQDGLDACMCLLVALHLAEQRACLMIGTHHDGFMVVPYSQTLYDELEARCNVTNRNPVDWLRRFQRSDLPTEMSR